MFCYSLTAVICLALGANGWAANIPKEELKSLDEQVQEIKKDIINQTAQLKRLEEKLLFPSNTQVALFVSVNNKKFALQDIELTMDKKIIAKYLYNFRDQSALQKGGVQRLFTGNINTGAHHLVVHISGRSPEGNPVRHSAKYALTKSVGPKFVEIKIAASEAADVSFQDW